MNREDLIPGEKYLFECDRGLTVWLYLGNGKGQMVLTTVYPSKYEIGEVSPLGWGPWYKLDETKQAELL
jgi:hypothetical protein